MHLRLSARAGWPAVATTLLVVACSSNNGGAGSSTGGSGGQAAGGAGGSGGQTVGAGGAGSSAGGTSGQGGQTPSGKAGGSAGDGGRTTERGTGGAGGAPGQGGTQTEPRADAAAGAGGQGEGGRTSSPNADAADLASGGAAGDAGGDTSTGSEPDTAAADAQPVGNPRRVLLCDEGNRRVLLVDLQSPSTAVWSTAINDPNKHGDSLRDLQLVGGDRVAVSTAKGYVELDLKTGAIKKEVSQWSGVESLRRLPSGNTVLGGNGSGGVTLQEVDSQDAPVAGHKVTFSSYSDLRILRRTPQGTFLLGVGGKLAEVNWDKQSLWEMSIPDGSYVYQGLRLPDNTLAVTSGYGAAIVVIDKAGKKVLRTIGGKGQPEAATIVPNFYAGFQVLPNGHFVVTNWEGHGGGNGGKGVQLLEYDAAGGLAWKWKQDPNLVSSLHQVIVLDGLDTTKLHDDVNGILAPVTE